MKLATVTNPVESGGITETNAFTIRTSATAFHILSSGLYSNKIRAIIRELSCNAIDSHIEAGVPTLPFEVHLPNGIEPWFAVRDFGTGLGHDDVMELYTTYFSSTKADSNDYTGALGLGSKSPFSYTENFSITAIVDGEQRTYTAYINEKGCPNIALMSTTKTTEGNGVEVKFGVKDGTDYRNFKNEAITVLQWFAVRPTINLSSEEFTAPDLETITEGISLKRTADYHAKTVAIQGNVAYPLDAKLICDNRTLTEFQKNSLISGFVFYFKIGELNVAASREELSYEEHTLNSIMAKLEMVEKHFTDYVSTELKTAKSTWDTGAIVARLYGNPVCRNVMSKCLKDMGISVQQSLNPSFEFEVGEFRKNNINLMQFESKRNSVIGRVQHTKNYRSYGGEAPASHRIPWTEELTLFVNDTTHGASDILKAYMGDKGLNYAMVIGRIRKTDDTVDELYQKALKFLGNPPKVKKVLLSTMITASPKLAPAKRTVSSPIHLYAIECGSYYGKVKVTGANIDLSDTATIRYYLPMADNKHVLLPSGDCLDTHCLRDFLSYVSHTVLRGHERQGMLFGAGPRRLAEVEKAVNWVSVYDEFKHFLDNISSSVSMAQALPARGSDEYIGKDMKNVCKVLDNDSPFALHWKKCNKILDEAEKTIGTGHGRNHIEATSALFGIEVKEMYQSEIDAIMGEHEAIIARYPMLALIDLRYKHDDDILKAAEYIELLDGLARDAK